MTASTEEVGGVDEAITPAASHVCSSINGRGESSRSPTRGPERARHVAIRRDAWKSIMTTRRPKSTRTSPSEDGYATPVTILPGGREEELKTLLHEGWLKGWLAFHRPACACRTGGRG